MRKTPLWAAGHGGLTDERQISVVTSADSATAKWSPWCKRTVFVLQTQCALAPVARWVSAVYLATRSASPWTHSLDEETLKSSPCSERNTLDTRAAAEPR